ncbi:MAG TPA: VIT1/CCC1 transporter family protein [Povalibacter sp.]|uniref:VIT1/CCC1 transporter family protein n=1 Tax=Povalibacter sp. TaxID=1962978 RepID=UPI002C14FCA6|nr:VIT1/CCC1 transporter family protein [Povalibacter sp.]HMN45508.1 VIT1/CCC1 transporter family protein [Povalibacter sp.]
MSSVMPQEQPEMPADASLMHRYLDPATSLAEILFGLIMTLTFTLSAGLLVADEGREGARQLLIAVIGCNVAWGIIDAMLYLVGQLFDRGRLRRLGRAIRANPTDARTRELVAGELDPLLGEILPSAERDVLYARIADNVAQRPERLTQITREDWLGAMVSFVLVVITSIPAAIPFLLIDQAQVALRVSNLVLLALLFVVGASWARYTLSRPWIVGTVLLVCGTALVLAAIALGG